MAAQRWTVFFTFLVMCTLKVDGASFEVCKQKVIRQLKGAIAALENCDCPGKSLTLSDYLQMIIFNLRLLINCFWPLCNDLSCFKSTSTRKPGSR